MHEMRLLLGVFKDTAVPVDTGAVGSVGLNAVKADADIAALVDRTQACGVSVAFEATADLGDFPEQVRVCTYRVVQEALTNAVKHAPGCSVAVRVDGQRDCVRVTVHTVGGANASPVNTGGLGLDGVRGRVTELGGRTSIGPVEGGWLVQAELPRNPRGRR
jgi:signal transduction histidine kinase